MNQWKKIAGIDCIVEEGDDSSAFVFLHGYGADAYDLYPLHEFFSFSGTWYFPNGILPVEIGYGMQGRAWFPITIAEKLQEALISGDWSTVENFSPDGLEEAREKLNQFLDNLPQTYEELVLAGFSQGAMLALEIFLHRKTLPKKLLLFSGTLLKKQEWGNLAKEKKDFHFFQSHGINDVLLPFFAAQKLNELLNESGMVGKLHSFPEGHTVPSSLLEPVNKYLNKGIV